MGAVFEGVVNEFPMQIANSRALALLVQMVSCSATVPRLRSLRLVAWLGAMGVLNGKMCVINEAL